MFLSRFLKNLIRTGELTVIDATGRTHRFGGGTPAVTIRLHDPALHWRLFFDPEMAAGEAYMHGTLTIENASVYEFLDLVGRNYAFASVHSLESPVQRIKRPLFRLTHFNWQRRARTNVAHHYDLSSKLYDLFLDTDHHYSCAYFANDRDSLEVAQGQKCRHIAAKLLLEPGMRVLDIGSGWGGLALYLSDQFQAEVVGITLSEEQVKDAQQRAARAGLRTSARFFLRDYRQESGIYDRVVSVGMFEHVGLNGYETYFRVVADRLVEDGVALLHTMGHLDVPGLPSSWLRKYIFPGGYVPTLSEVVRAIERAGLLVTDVEVLRLHYAKTLRHWRTRFLAKREQANALYDEEFSRMWEYYLASFEVAFRYLKLSVFQIQLAKRIDAVPLTRDYMFEVEKELPASRRMVTDPTPD